jgi:putative transposase
MRYTEEQIIAALNEAEAGANIQDVCRKYGISDTTFYRWRSKYGNKEIADASRLKQLEEENRRLKSIVADLTLRNQALKRVVSKKW